MERALGEPTLVLCGVCMDRAEYERRWLPLRCDDDEALLTRDVCVRPRCPNLQVRGHLCRTHSLELELAWQGNYTVRACHGCRVSTLQLYSEKKDVWFILQAGEYTSEVHGIERRTKIPNGVSTRKRPLSLGKRPVRRKSNRFIKQLVHREQTRAFEWSLGNLPLYKSRHLWRDNKMRVEMEKKPEAYYAAIAAKEKKKPVEKAPDVKSRPEPKEVFCAVKGCQRFAKTGNHCRFHSTAPLVFIKPVVEANATATK